jgi:hypothetical protein
MDVQVVKVFTWIEVSPETALGGPEEGIVASDRVRSDP